MLTLVVTIVEVKFPAEPWLRDINRLKRTLAPRGQEPACGVVCSHIPCPLLLAENSSLTSAFWDAEAVIQMLCINQGKAGVAVSALEAIWMPSPVVWLLISPGDSLVIDVSVKEGGLKAQLYRNSGQPSHSTEMPNHLLMQSPSLMHLHSFWISPWKPCKLSFVKHGGAFKNTF